MKFSDRISQVLPRILAAPSRSHVHLWIPAGQRSLPRPGIPVTSPVSSSVISGSFHCTCTLRILPWRLQLGPPFTVTQDCHGLSLCSVTPTRDLAVQSCLDEGSRVTSPLWTLSLLKAFFPPDIQPHPQSLDCGGLCVVAAFVPGAPFCILLFSMMRAIYALQAARCLCAQGFDQLFISFWNVLHRSSHE